ncbi:hypothetical protein [Rhodococcus sp. Leaf278]|nr:hypothetical protein [Rhodococcus sp. Leaf278]
MAITPVVTAGIGVCGPVHADLSSVDRTLRAGGDRAHHDSMS